MNLHQKIVQVRNVAGGFVKDKESFDYNYVTGNQILAKVRNKMNELNLLLIPSSEAGQWQTYDYKTAKGKEKTDFVVWGAMRYTWIDGDNPEDTLPISWAYYGQQDDISKAYGSALTYSERYFWLKCLGLPTDDDDPDGRKHEAEGSQKDSKQQGKQSYQKNNKTQQGTPDNTTGVFVSKDEAAKIFTRAGWQDGDDKSIERSKTIVKSLLDEAGIKTTGEIKKEELPAYCEKAELLLAEHLA